ncbi:Alpha/Beta hydrolase protein [Chaetomium tenue]|uniref:Alpha/Beta hydrolase protein n=1 Tax=Chaetomium tenue TaxID=1854479 RepID=A0ACB7PCH6_9PEZI|nr:Alpha/Beta hydrolase protein [Chaetomium globosum]
MTSEQSRIHVPKAGTRAAFLDRGVARFLDSHQDLKLGRTEWYDVERQKHAEVFALKNLPEHKANPIGTVEFTTVRGPHGDIPIRVLYPEKGIDLRTSGDAGALVYCHGGEYCVGSVDEFENGLRLIAETSGCLVVAVEYRLAPEFRYPVQLDEYSAVVDWVQGDGGRYRGVHPRRVAGGGDGVGGSMTVALCFRRRSLGLKPLAAQLLLYPAVYSSYLNLEEDEGEPTYYMQGKGTYSCTIHYLPLTADLPRPVEYVYPGDQGSSGLIGQPPAAILTNGFDPLREDGIRFARKMNRVGLLAAWKHYDDLAYGWLQMTPWSEAARQATCDAGVELRRLLYKPDIEEELVRQHNL